MTNPYELAGRMKKVSRMLPLLVRANITAEELARASESEWTMLHTALGIDYSSAETRTMCLERLREQEQTEIP